MSAALRRSFSSLHEPNYRRYFTGQILSLSGNWVQMVAEMWLILHLTGSGVAVGLTAALQFLPILLFAALGGALADRSDMRRLLIVTQALMIVPALALFAVTAAGAVEAWMVYVTVLLRGTINAVDNPTRAAFASELVGPDRVVNAVSLNSVMVHSARIVGPALAGIVIALAGVALCFAINALSFVAMLVALVGMDVRALHHRTPAPREKRAVRSALHEVRRRPELHIPLAMMAVVGTLAFNFQVLLPLLARFTWDGTATTYALLAASMGAGSVVGALATGARGAVGPRLLVAAAALFGAGQLLAAAAPVFALQALALVPVGAASVTLAAGINSSLQLAAGPALRGRIMALYAMVFLGSTPIGAPLAGWLADVAGPRAGLLLGAAAAFATAAGGHVAFRRAAASAPAPSPRGTPLRERRPGSPRTSAARSPHPAAQRAVAAGRRG
jgi:MFS family permease